tara:strand:- start:374 stop:613 length:240 start_codon:yes stop_codon:yes gene_type:complete
MNNISSSIFYILTGWTCAINIYKYFYHKKLKEYSQNTEKNNSDQLELMKAHYKKAHILGTILLTIWCISAAWYFYNLNA